MDWLWMLDAPFWMKLYFVSMSAGIAYFIYAIMEICESLEGSWSKIRTVFHDEMQYQKDEWIRLKLLRRKRVI